MWTRQQYAIGWGTTVELVFELTEYKHLDIIHNVDGFTDAWNKNVNKIYKEINLICFVFILI